MLGLFILIPLCVMVVFNIVPREYKKDTLFWAALALVVLQIIVVAPAHGQEFFSQGNALTAFLRAHLEVDALSLVALLAIGIVVAASLLVGRSMIPEARRRFNYANLVLCALAGMNGAVLVRDLFSLYVFLELTAIASFILIGFDNNKDGFEGALKYIIFSVIATVCMLSAIALLMLFAGDTSFAAVRAAAQSSPHNVLVLCAVGLFICGLSIKSGLVPFHGWLPDAYSAAPAFVSVLLAGIVTKIVGVYALIRITASVFDANAAVNAVLLFAGAVSIVIGALAALGQHDLKRLLAYSSISQVGYIILSIGCGTPLGMAGAIFHFLNHAIFKSLLFVNAAALEARIGTTRMHEMGGLQKKMPLTGFAAVSAGLSTAGIPPLAGFWSKLIIIIALWSAGYHLYAFIAVAASILTLAYMLAMNRKIFWRTPPCLLSPESKGGGSQWGITLPTIVLLALTLGGSLLFPVIRDTVFKALVR